MKETIITFVIISLFLIMILKYAKNSESNPEEKEESVGFPIDRIPFIPLNNRSETIQIQDKLTWIETVKASYPVGTQDGDIIRITSRLDRRCNSGLERHFSKICSFNVFGDMILIHAMRIDNFTELHGMREVYEECHQHVIDLWTLNGDMAIRKEIHHHSDYVMGDIVNGTCLGGIWVGRNRPIEDIDFDHDGKSVGFRFDGRNINKQI